jgi:hypothetical protein
MNMHPWRCSPSCSGCATGKQLAIEGWGGYCLLESPLLPSRPLVERERIWQAYQQAVSLSLRHCGYVGGEQEGRMAGYGESGA